MCEPATIAMVGLAISAASTAASVVAQNKAADAQTTANKRKAEAATQAGNANAAALDTEQQQQAQATSEQVASNNTAGSQAMATNIVAGGEAGVSGRSVNSLLRNLAGLNSADNANATTQYLRGDASIQARKVNINHQTNSVINTLQSAPGADYIGAGLRIGSAAVDYRKATYQPKG